MSGNGRDRPLIDNPEHRREAESMGVEMHKRHQRLIAKYKADARPVVKMLARAVQGKAATVATQEPNDGDRITAEIHHHYPRPLSLRPGMPKPLGRVLSWFPPHFQPWVLLGFLVAIAAGAWQAGLLGGLIAALIKAFGLP